MAYKVVLTKNALDMYERAVMYILEQFRDKFAAKRLVEDIENAVKRLEVEANSYPLCEDKDLCKRGLRKIHLKHHSYKIFYRIVNDREVMIDAILHDKQDFKNILRDV